jgi:hypothetical protein
MPDSRAQRFGGLCRTPLVDALANYATFKQKERRIPKGKRHIARGGAWRSARRCARHEQCKFGAAYVVTVAPGRVLAVSKG